MRVLMFGWEFPPMSSGGLGTACYGLTRALSTLGVQVTFVLPYISEDAHADFVNLIGANNLEHVKMIGVNSPLHAYVTSSEYMISLMKFDKDSHQRRLYGHNLFDEVYRFAEQAKIIADFELHDVIHCHDWMTYKAGINARAVSGRKLVIHVHATEHDRTGGHVNQGVYDIEREGMHAADRIITVSNFTKQRLVDLYGVPPEKIDVVHNAIDLQHGQAFRIAPKSKIVLFLGRITLQKGPDYFIEAANQALRFDPDLRFVMAGTGDMEACMIERAAELGIGDKVLFSGFVRDEELDRMYQMADVYVMPSVSEPFGITPLEAMKNGTPVIISKQSGVSEVIHHALKVDFWDINQLVDKILAVTGYAELHDELRHHSAVEIQNFSWDKPAKQCAEIYGRMMGYHG